MKIKVIEQKIIENKTVEVVSITKKDISELKRGDILEGNFVFTMYGVDTRITKQFAPREFIIRSCDEFGKSTNNVELHITSPHISYVVADGYAKKYTVNSYVTIGDMEKANIPLIRKYKRLFHNYLEANLDELERITQLKFEEEYLFQEINRAKRKEEQKVLRAKAKAMLESEGK